MNKFGVDGGTTLPIPFSDHNETNNCCFELVVGNWMNVYV